MIKRITFTFNDDKSTSVTIREEDSDAFMVCYNSQKEYVDPKTSQGVFIDKDKVRFYQTELLEEQATEAVVEDDVIPEVVEAQQ